MTQATDRTAPVADAAAPPENRLTTSARSVGTALIPVVIALALGAVVLAATGNNPIAIYARLATEAFGSAGRIDASLAAATPLLFTALAAAFAYRAGVFTVGVEGSFVLGGLTAAVVGAHMATMPAPVSIFLPLLAGAAAGTLVAAVPAFLRAYWSVDEVVTTLMFNFIAAGVAGWAVQTFFQAVGQSNQATEYVAANAQLPALNPPNQATFGLLIALAFLAAYWIFLRRSTLGFEFRAVGTHPRFAIAQGLRVRLVLLASLLVAGLIGGVGGGAHALGMIHRYTIGFSAEFGFTGIAIALIARFHPIGILIASLAFGALNAAGATVQLFIDLPVQIIDVLQGTVMVFAVASFALPRLRARRSAQEGDAR